MINNVLEHYVPSLGPFTANNSTQQKNALFIWICRSSAGRNAKAYVFLYYRQTVIIQLTDNNSSIFQQKRVDNVQNERWMTELAKCLLLFTLTNCIFLHLEYLNEIQL